MTATVIISSYTKKNSFIILHDRSGNKKYKYKKTEQQKANSFMKKNY